MKTRLTLAALLLLASPAIAQQETLFEGELEHAGYGGPAVMATIINDSVELNVFTNARLALGGSYRLVSGIDLPEYSNETIGGATGHLIFKFGSF